MLDVAIKASCASVWNSIAHKVQKMNIAGKSLAKEIFMSAHYGYFDIGVYKKDGTPDAAKAKEVFDWIKANCKWFNGEDSDALVLEDNRISNNSEDYLDGLDVKYNDDPFGDGVPNNIDFLGKAADAAKPEKIVASFYYDGSETSYDENFFTLSVWEDGTRRDIYNQKRVPRVYDEDEDWYVEADIVRNCDIDTVAFDFSKNSVGLKIADGVLEKCRNKQVEHVTIPASVTEIGDSAFDGCKSLSSIAFGGTMAQWEAVKGKLYLLTGSSVTVVKCADGDWKKPAVLVEDGAVVRCLDKSAESFAIPAGVTAIGDYAFSVCMSLSSVAIPTGVTKIGDSAFWKCTSLSSVAIPASVTKIGEYAFDGCKSLSSIAFGGTMAQWEAVKKDDDWRFGVLSDTVVHCEDGDVEL